MDFGPACFGPIIEPQGGLAETEGSDTHQRGLEQHPDTEFERGQACCRPNIAPPRQPSMTRG
jgi:hypothetical protein